MCEEVQSNTWLRHLPTSMVLFATCGPSCRRAQTKTLLSVMRFAPNLPQIATLVEKRPGLGGVWSGLETVSLLSQRPYVRP